MSHGFVSSLVDQIGALYNAFLIGEWYLFSCVAVVDTVFFSFSCILETEGVLDHNFNAYTNRKENVSILVE